MQNHQSTFEHFYGQGAIEAHVANGVTLDSGENRCPTGLCGNALRSLWLMGEASPLGCLGEVAAMVSACMETHCAENIDAYKALVVGHEDDSDEDTYLFGLAESIENAIVASMDALAESGFNPDNIDSVDVFTSYPAVNHISGDDGYDDMFSPPANAFVPAFLPSREPFAARAA